MNMKKGDRVYVETINCHNFFGYVEEVKEETVVVRLKMESMGRIVGDNEHGIVDCTPIIHEYRKTRVFPAKEYVEKKIKLLAKRLHNLTEFL